MEQQAQSLIIHFIKEKRITNHFVVTLFIKKNYFKSKSDESSININLVKNYFFSCRCREAEAASSNSIPTVTVF